MKNRIKASAALVLPIATGIFLAGCQTPPKPLYDWEGYQPQVYEYFKGGSPEQQILVLERDLQVIRSHGNVPPPGYYAQLGLLYVTVGKGDQAAEMFENEKRSFPESEVYMDFLLKKKNGKDGQ